MAELLLTVSISGAGSAGKSSNMTIAGGQTPEAGTEVEEGTIVDVEFRYLDVD